MPSPSSRGRQMPCGYLTTWVKWTRHGGVERGKTESVKANSRSKNWTIVGQRLKKIQRWALEKWSTDTRAKRFKGSGARGAWERQIRLEMWRAQERSTRDWLTVVSEESSQISPEWSRSSGGNRRKTNSDAYRKLIQDGDTVSPMSVSGRCILARVQGCVQFLRSCLAENRDRLGTAAWAGWLLHMDNCWVNCAWIEPSTETFCIARNLGGYLRPKGSVPRDRTRCCAWARQSVKTKITGHWRVWNDDIPHPTVHGSVISQESVSRKRSVSTLSHVRYGNQTLARTVRNTCETTAKGGDREWRWERAVLRAYLVRNCSGSICSQNK